MSNWIPGQESGPRLGVGLGQGRESGPESGSSLGVRSRVGSWVESQVLGSVPSNPSHSWKLDPETGSGVRLIFGSRVMLLGAGLGIKSLELGLVLGVRSRVLSLG